MKKDFVFFSQSLKNFHHTGAVCSTSTRASQTLAKPVKELRYPKRILEVGAGTGPVTEQILSMMSEEDHLTSCEINSSFMKILKERLSKNNDFNRLKNNISLKECPIQELQTNEKFDIIVCSLPFLNFNKQTVHEIFVKLKELSSENAIMTYYQYIGLSELGKKVSPPKRKKRMREIDQYFKENINPLQIRKENVWRNISPITVYFLKLNRELL